MVRPGVSEADLIDWAKQRMAGYKVPRSIVFLDALPLNATGKVMKDQPAMSISDVYRHSMVIASDYRIPDPVKVGRLLEKRKDRLAAMGAHHVLVYRSLREAGRVLVLIGVRSREPIVDLLRSREFFDSFDAAGVDDIPAVFAGEIVDRYDLTESDEELPPGVLVSAIVSVDNTDWLFAELHAAADTFKAARGAQGLGVPGIRRPARGADPAGHRHRGQRQALDPPARCGRGLDGARRRRRLSAAVRR